MKEEIRGLECALYDYGLGVDRRVDSVGNGFLGIGIKDDNNDNE